MSRYSIAFIPRLSLSRIGGDRVWLATCTPFDAPTSNEKVASTPVGLVNLGFNSWTTPKIEQNASALTTLW
ncbi:MAG: hypothetical protein ACK5YO_06585, partial [Planctomyces sp.]